MGAFYASTTSLIQVDVTPEAIAGFAHLAGITYDISSPSQYILEVSQLVAQTALTAFAVLVGSALVVFVEPPVAWFVGGNDLSGDWRPTILSGVMLFVFFVIVSVPPLRTAFEIMPLSPLWYAAIALVALMCILFLRATWRGRWLERFLGMEF